MADHSLANTACTTDSSQATGSGTSSVSSSGPATRTLTCETSATAMARFSLDLRDLEAASALGAFTALGVVPETRWPSTEAIMHELSTDAEVTFRKVLGSAEILPTRPGVDPLEVTRPMPDLSGTSQLSVTASPSVITSQPSHTLLGSLSPAASYVFGSQPNIWSTPDQRQANPTSLQYITSRCNTVAVLTVCVAILPTSDLCQKG